MREQDFIKREELLGSVPHRPSAWEEALTATSRQEGKQAFLLPLLASTYSQKDWCLILNFISLGSEVSKYPRRTRQRGWKDKTKSWRGKVQEEHQDSWGLAWFSPGLCDLEQDT